MFLKLPHRFCIAALFTSIFSLLQAAALHEAGVGLLGLVAGLGVGHRSSADATASQQAAEGLQTVLGQGQVSA